jgi:hypothetical protein
MMSEGDNRQKARYRREMIGYTTATTIIANLCPRAGGWKARSGEVWSRQSGTCDAMLEHPTALYPSSIAEALTYEIVHGRE